MHETNAPLSLPLSVSPFSHSVERAPCPLQQQYFSHPQFASIHLTLAMLSPSNCAEHSPNPQISFLGIPNDLTSIQLCLRDKANPRPAYYSAILTPQTTSSLTIHQSMDIWALSIIWLLFTMLLYTSGCMYTFESVLLYHLGIYQVVQLLGHKIFLLLTF